MVAAAEPEPSVDPPVPAVAGQQLSLFPTEAQQFHIIQEAESAQAAPFASSIPQEVIDDFLRHGSNTAKSRMHIIAALYPWHTPDTDWLTEKARETFVNILRREYHGGYGLIVDGEKFAAWYDDQGLRVCRGTSARYSPFAQTVPWNDVLERVWHLYGDGKFSTNVEAVEAHGNECREVALSLLYLYYDRTAQCRGKYLTSLDPYAGGGFPEEQARLAEALADQEKAFAINEDLDAFMEAYDADRSLLNWHYHKLPLIESRFASLLVSWDSVVPQAAAELTHNPFITEDELDAAISSGSNYEGGKKRIYDYFTVNPSHTQKDKADFLKDEFGTGGHSHALSGADSSMEDYDAKGLRFRKGDCPEVTISWPNAAKRIDTLIRMNRYLTPEEQAREAEIRDAHYEPEESEILPGDDSDAPGDESVDVAVENAIAVETPKHEAVIIGEEDHTLYLYASNGLSGELDLNGRKRQPEEALVVAAPAAYLSSDIMFAKDVTFLKIGRDISAEDLTGTKEDQLAAMKKAAASIHSEPWEAYTRAKQDFQGGIVLLRVGDDYEILGEDAEKAADALGLSLSSRHTPDGRVPMCRFSMSDLYDNVRKLNEKWNVRAVDYKDENHEQRISEDYPSFFNLLLQGKKTGRTRVERNYKAFARLFPEIVDGTYRYLQLRAPEETGYMPLTIEKIGDNEYSVSHHYESNGDLMYDPEMTFRIDAELGTLEPLTFRQDGSPALYQEVYPEPGKWIPKLRNSLSSFTETWLKNIEVQGRVRFRAIAERDGEDVEFSFDEAGNPVPLEQQGATELVADQSVAGKASEKKYDIGFGYKGNGLTVWNRLEIQNGDYKTIAHIDADRRVSIYDATLPEDIIAQIYDVAAHSEMTVSATQDTSVFTAPAQERVRHETEHREDGLSARYEEYQALKEADAFTADGLLLYQMGELYELFGEDAETAANALDLTAVTWNSPEHGPVSMVGIPSHNLEHYLTILRDTHDVTVASGGSAKQYLSIDHEAKKAINEHEAEFGADGWRAFGGHPYFMDETEQGAPSHDTPSQPSAADPTPMAGATAENAAPHDTPRQREVAPVREMTSEEIDAALRSWNGRAESKNAVVHYMQEHGRERGAAEWLKNEFKSENPDLFDRVRLEKGLTLINRDGSAETVLPWPKVQRRIAQLIRDNTFFTPEPLSPEKEQPPESRASEPEATGAEGEIDNGEAYQAAIPGTELMKPEENERQAFEIKNLADLKRHITVGAEVVCTYHANHPDLVGLTRVVSKVQTNGFYSQIKDQPHHKWSVCNSGNGIYSDFQKADTYRFTNTPNGTSIQVLDRHDKNRETVLLEMMVYPGVSMERAEQEQTPIAPAQLPEAMQPRWPVDVGDTVYLEDGKAFIVEQLSDNHIQLRDPTLIYPILRAESYESFQRLMDRFPQPGVTDDEPVAADEPEITYEPIVVNNDTPRGESFDVAIQTIRRGEPKEPIQVKPENFRITDDHLGEGGPKTKFRANMEAISTLKQIEAEGRNATPEEQETLSRYVGWGGLADAFDENKADWSKEYTELKEALTPEEYTAARASTLNAHYTSPTVIRAIYDALGNMGFTTGNILEPACGVGNFFGCLPQDMSSSKLYGVELDSVSGRIAKQLYPNANITVAGFETTDRRDFYDVAIGNVPFGQYQVNDRAYNKLGFSIHNYFFAKALDQVRPGGVVAFVTSRYTMDAKDSTVRRYLAQRADFLGAIRLPNNAFRANAGTDVVSDIIFLQKREKPSLDEPDWLFTSKNIPDNTPAKVGDVITFTTGYPAKEYTAEVTEVGKGYANVPYYRGKNEEREFSYISPSTVTGIERKSDLVYEINQYFLDHPEMVLGDAASESTQFGRMDYTVVPKEGVTLAEQLHAAVGKLQGSYLPVEQPDLQPDANAVQWMPADPMVRNNSYTLVDGHPWFRENSIMRRIDVSATTEARIKGMVELRDSMRSLLDLELDENATDDEIAQKQAELSRLYDAFTERYGLVNDRANELAFAEDPSYFLLCSLEEQDRDGKTYHKAVDIFTKRTIKQQRSIDHVDTAADALAVSIGQKACVDLPFMARLMGGEEYIPQIVEDLHGVIFKDPASGPFDLADGGEHWDKGWQPADEYLSGNVRVKLRQAEAASKDDPFFEINAEALKRAQPKDLEASEIEARIGSTWIAPEIFEQFMFETFKTPLYLQNYIHVRYSPHSADWFIEGKNTVRYGDMAATNTFGTTRANAYQIMEESLNLRDVRVYDKVEEADGKERRVLNAKETTLAAQKQQAIRDAFRDWLWKDPERREKLVRQYNEEMNSTRPREYDGKHLVFSGINPEITLREHQLNAIAHVIYGGNTLLAHEVGAGKTFEMVAAAMESKRLGLCSKSLFVVPNHLISQWASEFLRLYPAANILVTTKRDFEPARRKKFCSRIATGDYDAVIIGQSQFEKIPVSEERQRMFLERQIEDITEALQDVRSEHGARFTIKELEKTKRGLEAKLEKLQGSDRKDDTVTFEQLGIDRLFVDESDNYKNLFLYTKMRNVAGLSTSDAQKSSDMFAKCRYLDELTGNRGVIFATGTPISNSMTEMYTIHRYLQYDRLQEMGMGHFDCWASRFGETTTALELAPEGTGYRARTRFAKFFNLPELMTFFKEVADIKTADQLNLPTPEVEYHNIVAQPTEIQKELVQTLSKRASKVHSGAVDPKVDNMLKITSDGRKLGLDQRLIDPLLPDVPGTKVNLCVENLLKYWREGEADKLTQLVFCDVSTPSGRSSHSEELSDDAPFTNIYADIRRKLIKGGMPAEQIAFIHDADTEKRKEELFSKMRSGEVRVLIGSTAKMGAGTNVQDKLIASHDLDCPWRPRDLTQRKGRIERQGNTNSKVHVCRYVTEGTFDAYLWQTVENKQKFISQVMTSKSPVRTCDDMDETALSFAEIKALCAGDPRIKERMDLDVEVSKLRLMKADHNSNQYRIQDMLLRYYPEMIEVAQADIRGLEADMEILAANPLPQTEEFVGMEVRGDRLSDKKNAGAALISACQEMVSKESVKIGRYRGFDILASYDTWERQYRLTLKGHAAHRLTLGADPVGNLIRMENALAKMPDRLDTAKAELSNYRKQMETAAVEVKKPFPFEQELADKTARLVELDLALNLDKDQSRSQEPDRKKKHEEVR